MRSEGHAEFTNSVKLGSFGRASLPLAATHGTGLLVFFRDDPGAATVAVSDGSIWHRIRDNVQVR